ncbi:MAG: YHS domain-containing protein [Candidatus Freyarchaeota archaeon]
MEDIGKAIDPVCKMEVDKRTAKWKSEYKGRTYYFLRSRMQTSI